MTIKSKKNKQKAGSKTRPHRLSAYIILTQFNFVLSRNTTKQFTEYRALNDCITEFIAGITDSIATQIYKVFCWYLYQTALIQPYFECAEHIHWICYFLHMNISGPIFWGKTYRNSLSYCYVNGKKQNIFHTSSVVFVQYISIFIGLCLSIWCVDYFHSQPNAQKIIYSLVGKPDGSGYNTDFKTICIYIIQTLLFQFGDRLINRIEKLLFNESKWLQSSYRCLTFHYLITNKHMHVILNPNFALYSCLFYWRWNIYDFIILILPYIVLFIWNSTFAKIPLLDNPKLSRIQIRSKKKKNN